MNEQGGSRQHKKRCWAGLDWGGSGHAVSVVDDRRRVLASFAVGASLEDLESLSRRLRACGDVAGVAVEATRHPVVGHLLSAGFAVYAVNPKQSKNWRGCASVSASKSDARDGLVLAVELAGRHESLRPIRREDPAVAELAGLCEKVRELVDERTALVQRLKATLGQYYPGALGFFSDWTSPVAWRFVKRFPRPKTLAQARKETLCAFLKSNRVGLRPVWLERIEARGDVARWPLPADSAALEAVALATVAQLLALQPHIDKMDRLIAEQSKQVPQTKLMQSLPGAGKRLAPALAAMAALTTSGEKHNLAALRCVSGVAPVEDKSGKRQRVRARRRCNRHWRDVLHLFAHCSINCCDWARAFYDMHREQGDNHAGALRKLADKWLKIIHRMVEANEPYDDLRHVQSLRNHASWFHRAPCGKPGGKLH